MEVWFCVEKPKGMVQHPRAGSSGEQLWVCGVGDAACLTGAVPFNRGRGQMSNSTLLCTLPPYRCIPLAKSNQKSEGMRAYQRDLLRPALGYREELESRGK